MRSPAKPSRARWVAVLCAIVAVSVAIASGFGAVRFVRERRAIAALRSDDAEVRSAALEDLASIGTPRALRVILGSLPFPDPDEGILLIEVGRDSWESRCGRAIHSGHGRKAVPRLRSMLRSVEPRERYWALHFLSRTPELAAEGPGPAMLDLLDDSDRRVRSEAALTVATSAGTQPLLLERLIQDLETVHLSGRYRAAVARVVSLAALREPGGTISASARSVAAALRKASGDAVTVVRAECARGLCSIEDHWRFRDPVRAREVQRFLATRLSEPEPEIRSVLAAQLRETACIPILVEVLEGGPPEARIGIVDVLRSIDGDQVWLAAVALVERAKDVSVRETTLELLSSLSKAEEVDIGIDLLVRGLFSTDGGVQRAAVKVLRRQGGFDHSGILPLVEHEDAIVRLQALKALSWSVNIDAGTLEQTVLELLAEARTDLLRESACKAAPSLGPAASRAVPLLASLVEGGPWEGRHVAAEALGDIGPAARSALPALTAAARGSDPDLAVAAIRALSKVSPDGCADLVAASLGHRDERVRDAALEVLWGLGSAAAPALPALRKLAGDARAAALLSSLEAEAREPPVGHVESR